MSTINQIKVGTTTYDLEDSFAREKLENVKGSGIQSITKAEYDALEDKTGTYVVTDEEYNEKASDIGYDNTASGLVSNNIQGAIDELKKSASDGKKLVADAITGKGITTATDASYATMASNIGNIQLGSGDALPGDVLSGKTYSSDEGTDLTGTMPNQGAKTSSLNCGDSYTIPAGYHNGSGKITANSLSSQTTVQSGKTAIAAAQVLTGYEGWVNGSRITGAMANRGAWTGATSGSGNVTIPAGYHNGSGYVSGSGAYNAGVSATKKGTAGAGDVLTGKTFTNASSVGASGTMANKGGTTVDAGSVTSDSSYTYLSIPANGYYNTSSKLRILNSNLSNDLKEIHTSGTKYANNSLTLSLTVPSGVTKGYLILMNTVNSTGWSVSGDGLTSQTQKMAIATYYIFEAVLVPNKTITFKTASNAYQATCGFALIY